MTGVCDECGRNTTTVGHSADCPKGGEEWFGVTAEITNPETGASTRHEEVVRASGESGVEQEVRSELNFGANEELDVLEVEQLTGGSGDE